MTASLLLTSCASTTPACNSPQSRNLSTAISTVQASLMQGCHAHFDRYYDDLLSIAEGDPKPENKREFSEFLVWSSDQGLLSTRQAQEHYNRYFNVKFMSLKGDYNNCSHTCPNKRKVLTDMERELRRFRYKVEAGANVVVFGLGGIGLNVLQGARMVGANKIVGVDLNNGRKEMATQFGMTHFINPKELGDKDVVAEIVEIGRRRLALAAE